MYGMDLLVLVTFSTKQIALSWANSTLSLFRSLENSQKHTAIGMCTPPPQLC